MKKLFVLVCATAIISLAAGAAIADSIAGKIGITGKLGFQIPSNGDLGPNTIHTDTGFIGGGGVIYGIDNHFAVELDLTRSVFGSNYGEFGVTNVTLGGQYRFALEQPKLVPYVGAGLDILAIDADQGRNVDTTVGVHASAGMDYFILKQLALTTEAKFVIAPDTDITGPTGKVGNFDPVAFSTTFGLRYFFN